MVWVEILILFLVSALISAAEMATFSARVERMRQAHEAGNHAGRLVLVYQRSPVAFLAAGQVLATAANFLLGAIISNQLTPMVTPWFLSQPWIQETHAQPLASGLTLVVMTIAALIVTNVIPKQIGFDHADAIALWCARPFYWLIRITRPLAWLVSRTSKLAEDAVNRRARLGARVTEKDLLTLIREGIRIGAIDKRESEFVTNAFQLSERTCGEVMTPIAEIEALDLNWDRKRIEEAIRDSSHSYLPVFRGGWNDTAGLLRVRDWYCGGDVPLTSLLSELPRLNEKQSAIDLFETLRARETKMTLVEDENQVVVGVITLNDAVTLVAGRMKSIEA
ncbi:MAG: hemolysin family protein [Fimbriimonadaceae bacterium]